MISDNSFDELKKILPNAEATKIYNEIHQLRNHQFYITLAALTFFGVSLGKVFDILKTIGTDAETLSSQLTLIFSIMFGLQIILFGLFYWLTGLSKLIAILSVYLKKKNYSDWEFHFSKISEGGNVPASQRQLMAWVFLILGTLSPIIAMVNFLLSYLYLQDNRSSETLMIALFVIVLVVISAVYYCVIDNLGFKHPSKNREIAENLWDSHFTNINIVNKSQDE